MVKQKALRVLKQKRA